MNGVVPWFRAWRKQPTTIVCFALIVGAGVYWVSKDVTLAGVAAGAVAGGLNDNTKALLTKTEALEDSMRSVLGNTVVTANTVSAMSARTRAGFATGQDAPSPDRLVPRT